MNRISAAENTHIDFDNTRWVLTVKDEVLVAAQPTGLSYSGDFAETRRLPAPENTPVTDFMQVVLGYQQRDETWRLGLVVAPQLAELRNSRWCELVHWPDPDEIVFKDDAIEAGRALSAVLGLPFRLVQSQPAEPQTPPPPLPALPLRFGLWSIQSGGYTGSPLLTFRRSSRWGRSRLMRGLWYFVWAVIYIFLSVATLTSDLALPAAGTLLPDPLWLPYLGVIIGVGLVFMALYQWYRARTVYDRIEVDATSRTVTARRGDRVKWQVAGADVQSVYVSEVVKKKDAPASEHGEINLHLGTGKYRFVLEQGEAVDNNNARKIDEIERKKDQVIALNRRNLSTDLQAAAVYLAESLGDIPVWYDMRVK